MFELKKLFCLFAGAFLFISISAGPLEDFSRELNFLELSLTHAAVQPKTSENHLAVKKRLQNFNTKLIHFYENLKRQRIPNIPNFPHHSAGLLRVFLNLSVMSNNMRIPRFKGTDLHGYNSEHQRYLRQRNAGKRSKREYPTLKTVNIPSYKAWLERISQNYIRHLHRLDSSQYKSSRTRKNRNSNRKTPDKLNSVARELLETYVLHIVELRVSFAQLAQNKYYKQ